MADIDGIQFERSGAVAVVTLNRPEKLNALTPPMLMRLEAVAAELDTWTDVRAVVLTGSGTKAFCVGADINEWSALTPLDMWRQWVPRGHRIFDRWAALRVPVIAAINGHALGGGLELAAVADIRIADPAATFALPEAGIATCPGWSGTQRLVSIIGASKVKILALTGRRIDATRAHEIGLIDELASAGGVLNAALEMAEQIARLAPVSVQLTKQLVNAANGEGAAATLEAMAGALAATTADAREGMLSFREKRPANFEGN
ncbi:MULTISPECIES: enoyl-CoA hydratase/isomerase family protein [unclassified Paraburkholderia]|uniref:enoyl-CoA hydratase/isomerase family protein n=1 Tax=unclassified Paraburkholderia TaxID=2615204 RepID=UPI00162017C9|nr:MULTISPECIES: enoyl-CoA hydratase/isomerase family protein [unclassified Paraburkholderia]MBB5443706.1 enoyl-CoA hydratase/carnithine racemase [Paraburkholderia sp. WSM4177]MBB5485167.1 enoyl-CoA hydratase/carnithine racemase [Paraburkholderia sp. WSM4180]